MAVTLISDRVRVARRYVRAVDLARDFGDPEALDGYVVTPSVRDGLVRILAGLRTESTQRAFRITGPYGSGKSSFGLLLARIFAETEVGDPARRILDGAVGNVAVPDYVPIVLVGRRTSLADELLRAIMTAAGSDLWRDEACASASADLLRRREQGDRDPLPVLDLLSSYADALARRTGHGVLLLIDEMGRYLEFAAANPAREDPSIFQLLAERAGGAASSRLGVVGFLHHRFGDYVAGLGDWMEGEWARSSERYEEIAFQESTEQTLHLMAQALVPTGPHRPAIRKAAACLYASAAQRQLFATSAAAIEKVAERLYPLHPAALACLASSARRFGQNERSVFSFLQSLEPAGFQRFAHENAYQPGHWYRVDHLFDYLAAQGSFRFRSADRERRWQLALDATSLCADMAPFQLSVLKAVSIFAVLEPISGIRSDPSTIAWSLELDEELVESALRDLIAKGVIHERSARGDYSLWSHSSVDLDRWLEDAKAAVPAITSLNDQLSALPAARPLIAHRHYHRTGTLRTFATLIGERAATPAGDEDGALFVLPVHPGEDFESSSERARQLSIAAGELGLVRTRRITAANLAQTHELACWNWVRGNCPDLRVDEIARAEVNKRIASLEGDLVRLFAPFSDPGREAAEESWFHHGERVAIRSRAELSRRLSDICDHVFRDAPVLRNELINRDKLSSAIAAARMRLLELMLTKSDQEYLGLEGAPPERTIYLSLFQASGLHAVGDGGFEFRPPTEEDPQHWGPTWDRIDEIMRERQAIRFDELMAELTAPPIGLRAGPALLIITAYMLHNRNLVALMERHTFQPEITPAHFMRLAKNPANFGLRHVAVTEGADLLAALAGGLSIWNEAPSPELKPIVEALYRWWGSLSDYAKITRSIDKKSQDVRSVLRKARDPVELVFRTLPDACGALDDSKIDVERFVATLEFTLAQIADALPSLQRRAEAALLSAFGARTLGRLRQQVQLDYQDHLLELADRPLRAFVDRALNQDLSDAAWLDGVASLVAGRRLESWEDETVDLFAFEIRALAQRLARRLAQIREMTARSSPITAVHLTAPDGKESSLYVRTRDASGGRVADGVRELLDQADDPDSLLIELLAERLSARNREKAT